MISAPRQPQSLLIVENSDEDFEALRRIIQQVSTLPLTIQRCIDGDHALDFLDQVGEYQQVAAFSLPEKCLYPRLIILDLNLPGTDGREVLATIKQSETFKAIPVVVFSTSSNPQDIATCYQSGVNGYMLKPMKINELRAAVQILLNYWFTVMVLPDVAAGKI